MRDSDDAAAREQRREAIEAVFEEALDVATDRRRAWLAARCGADVALAAEVRSLLDAHERTDGILDRPAA